MNLRITHKLFIAFFVTTMVTVVVMAIMVKVSLDRGFLAYINQVQTRELDQVGDRLGKLYLELGSWEELRENKRLWRRITRPRPNDSEQQSDSQLPALNEHSRGHVHHLPVDVMLSLGRRLSLLDLAGNPVAGVNALPDDTTRHAVVAGGETVGWLRLKPLHRLEENLHKKFVRRQGHGFYVIAGFSLLIAAIASLVFARQFLRPIRTLASGTRKLTGGDLEIRLPEERRDEFGELANDFNRLASTLSANERNRRQWVMDIAHELRTPLTILRAEIESLEDGVRDWSPGVRDSLKGEILRLSKLVNDLYELSQADSGNLRYDKVDLDLVDLVREVTGKFASSASRKNLSLKFLTEDDIEQQVYADRDRLVQLLGNLLENAIRYTGETGSIEVRNYNSGGRARVEIRDSAPGVPPESLDRLFDRLYRVDQSRNRDFGGAGIGLAMARQIASDHSGIITASHSSLGGLQITVELPLMIQQPDQERDT